MCVSFSCPQGGSHCCAGSGGMMSQLLPFKVWDIGFNHQWDRVVLRYQILSCSSWVDLMGLLLLKRTVLYAPSSLLQISLEGLEVRVCGSNSIKKYRQTSQSFSIKAILLIYKPRFPELKEDWWWDLVGLFCFYPKCIFQISAISGCTLLYLTRVLLSAWEHSVSCQWQLFNRGRWKFRLEALNRYMCGEKNNHSD